jgi:hypothetical protein
VQTDLAARTVSPAAVELPQELCAVAERMRCAVPQLADFYPNEANVIVYRRSRGDHLLPHVDDRNAPLSLKIQPQRAKNAAVHVLYAMPLCWQHSSSIFALQALLQLQRSLDATH